MSIDSLEVPPNTPPVPLARLLLAPLRAMRRSSRESAYADFTARPWGAVAVTLWYNAWLGVASLVVRQHLLITHKLPAGHGYNLSIKGIAIAWLFYFGANAVLLPAYGILVRFGLRRVLRESMPDETAPLGVPPGVWLSLAWSAPMVLLGLLVCAAMVVQPWLPALGVFGKSGFTTLGIIGYIVPLYMVRTLYGIRHRSAAGIKLSLIVVTPAILLALVGIVLAIAFGFHKIHGQAANAVLTRSQDMNCNGHGPMLMPSAPQDFGATVIGPVSQNEAMAVIQNGQRHANGLLDPEYLYIQRVALHPDVAQPGSNTLAVIPSGLGVTIGQHVVYRTGYADPDRACHYFPNMIKR